MAIGAYLSIKSQNEYFRQEIQRERREVDEMPEKERQEVDDILNTSVRLVRGEFDSGKIQLDKIPSVRDIITQGAGWR